MNRLIQYQGFEVVMISVATEDPPEYPYLYLIPAGSFIGGYALATQGNFPDIHQMTYLAASLCCVGALTGLSSQKTCRIGNILGMIGVSSGIAATLGIVKPTNEVLTQMIACMGSGESPREISGSCA